MSFAPLVLLYNSTGRKTAVELFSQSLSGSYPFMQSWLSRLETHTNNHDSKSASDLVHAFDNNQRLQKVWLSRISNKQTLDKHDMT